MNIAHQFEEVRIFLANDGLVPVPEEMTGALVSFVERDGVAGQEAPHERRQAGSTAAKQEMEVIGR